MRGLAAHVSIRTATPLPTGNGLHLLVDDSLRVAGLALLQLLAHTANDLFGIVVVEE